MKYINKRLKNYTAEKHGEYYQVFRGGEFENLYRAELIEGSSDWQLKPSFEITAFRYESGSVKYKLGDGGFYYCECQGSKYEYETLLTDFKIPIFSVIREDGIEFKIGDKTNEGIIKGFEIGEEWTDGICACFNREDKSTISLLTPAKKVILTTFDGVEIYDPEQKLFSVNEHMWIIYDGLTAKYIPDDEEEKFFSTRESAEDYINKNKPKYSENQIREVVKNIDPYYLYADDLIHKLNEKI